MDVVSLGTIEREEDEETNMDGCESEVEGYECADECSG